MQIDRHLQRLAAQDCSPEKFSPSLCAELYKLVEDVDCGREPHLIPALLFPYLCVCSVFVPSPPLIRCWDSTFSGLSVSRIFLGCGVSHQQKTADVPSVKNSNTPPQIKTNSNNKTIPNKIELSYN